MHFIIKTYYILPFVFNICKILFIKIFYFILVFVVLISIKSVLIRINLCDMHIILILIFYIVNIEETKIKYVKNIRETNLHINKFYNN